MNALKAAGAVPKWGCESPESGAAGTTRQNKFNGELKMAGIKVGLASSEAEWYKKRHSCALLV